MQVKALTSKSQEDLPATIRKAGLAELLATVDILSLHCPLTDDTRNMMNAETLRLMKPTAILINTGRGPLVNEADVAGALASGRLAAYCADVMAEEPPGAENPLLQQPNAYITPHVAWATREARIRLLQVAIDNVRSFVGQHPQNVV
jgi:glycerate dehydrogenase